MPYMLSDESKKPETYTYVRTKEINSRTTNFFVNLPI